MDLRSKNILPFNYVFPAIALSASQSAQATLQMQQAAAFELHAIYGTCTQDLDTDFEPSNFSVQFTDQSTGQQMSNLRVPQRLLCGPSDFLYREIRPVIFAPGATILADVLDLSAQSNTVTLVWRGYLLLRELQQ